MAYEELIKYCSNFDITSYHSLANEHFAILAKGRQILKADYPKNETVNYKGFRVKVGENKFRIILGDASDNYLYRGENNSYPLLPSLQRKNVDHCVEWIKADMFKTSFKKTPYYKYLPENLNFKNYKFDFDLEALAQHYGFRTNYIDLTMNPDVAKFFAYTYYQNGKYHPIDDFKEFCPRIYRVKLYKLVQYDPKLFQVVGFQVAKRPQEQEAMAIDLTNTSNNIKDELFETIYLEKSAKAANEVYQKFNRGESLFPPEEIANLAKVIKENNNISEDSLRNYAYKFKQDPAKLRCKLQRNYRIQNKHYTPAKIVWDEMMTQTNTLSNWVHANIGYSYEGVIGEKTNGIDFVLNKITNTGAIWQVARINNTK